MFTGSEVLQAAATVCVAGAALGCLYLVFVGFSVLRFRLGEQALTPVAVPVSVLVPLCGSEPGLAARLRALRDQTYAGATEIICGTLDPHDPAIEVVRQVARGGQTLAQHGLPGAHGLPQRRAQAFAPAATGGVFQQCEQQPGLHR